MDYPSQCHVWSLMILTRGALAGRLLWTNKLRLLSADNNLNTLMQTDYQQLEIFSFLQKEILNAEKSCLKLVKHQREVMPAVYFH